MADMKHILIADDEELLCVTIADYLRDSNYRVSIVHDGTGVLPILETDRVDLVLLDLMMPKMGGFDTLAIIKKHSPETRIIILSGYGSDEHIQQAKLEGADVFISKPFGVESLLNHVKEVLAGSRKSRFHEPGIE
jgi:DNA-binding response OmpR family regulator